MEIISIAGGINRVLGQGVHVSDAVAAKNLAPFNRGRIPWAQDLSIAGVRILSILLKVKLKSLLNTFKVAFSLAIATFLLGVGPGSGCGSN